MKGLSQKLYPIIQILPIAIGFFIYRFPSLMIFSKLAAKGALMSEKITIEINGNETVEMRKGAKMTFLAKKTDSIEFDCYKSDCGICIFSVVEGENNLSEKTTAEDDFLKAMRADSNERLACQCRALGHLKIEADSF